MEDEAFYCCILNISPAVNGDVVVKVTCKALVDKVEPGQYLYIALDDDLSNKSIAYLVGSEPIKNEISLYINTEIFSNLKLKKGNQLKVSAPQGRTFPPIDPASRLLIIADASGLPSVLFLSQLIVKSKLQKNVFILLSTDSDFPFRSQPAKFLVSDMPAHVMAACPLLDDRNIANRLVSGKPQPGCFDGEVSELLNDWLPQYLACEKLTVFASGQPVFLKEIVEVISRLGVNSYLLELPNNFNS